MNTGPIVALTFFAYLLVMLLVGWIAYRRTTNLSDYILGGRGLGPLTSALSAGASDMSGWLLMGLPGAAFAGGLGAAWIAIGLLIGTWMNWRFMAPRLRVYSYRAGDALTLPEFLEHRFRTKGHLLRLISAAFILLFFLFYTASGLVAGGKLFETVFGVPYAWAVCIGALAVISYTLLGGFLAVCWTDTIQGLMMAAALAVLPVVAIGEMGGVAPVADRLRDLNPNLLRLWHDPEGLLLQPLAVISALAWGLGYFGQPHILARFAAVRGVDSIPTARRIAVGWTALTLACAVGIGLVGAAYFAGEVADGERVFMLMVDALFHPVVAGILLAAILAAVMSTADSQLLVCSAALTEDIATCFLKTSEDPKKLVRLGRGAVVLIALAALGIALGESKTVLGLVSHAWAGFGATFGPVLLLSLYWRRSTAIGAVAGMIAGGLTTALWARLDGGVFDLYEIVPGCLLATLAMIAGSLFSPEPSSDIQAEFTTVVNELKPHSILK